MMDIIYRSLDSGEEKAASIIEKQCLDTAWSESQIAELPENAFYVGAFDENELCGIASAYFVLDEAQIMNVAVSEQHRKKGIAFGLMRSVIDKALEKNCQNVTLEVAENNIPAISLYEKCGFSTVGKRKNFYGGVSALIMEKKL